MRSMLLLTKSYGVSLLPIAYFTNKSLVNRKLTTCCVRVNASDNCALCTHPFPLKIGFSTNRSLEVMKGDVHAPIPFEYYVSGEDSNIKSASD